MKNKIVIILILCTMTLLCFFVFRYKISLVIYPIKTDIDVVQKDSEEVVNNNEDGKILLGDVAKFENLNENEKNICKSFYNLIIDSQYRNTELIDGCYLKYYNNDFAFIGYVSPKPTLPLQFFNIKNNTVSDFENGSNQLNVDGGFLENEKYLITVNYDSIIYFKPGMGSVMILPKSELKNKGETYLKKGGMLNNFEFSLTGNTLKVSVFKNENKQDIPNTKLREVEFVLP